MNEVYMTFLNMTDRGELYTVQFPYAYLVVPTGGGDMGLLDVESIKSHIRKV